MRIGLTGATGFIGSHVLGELARNGHDVTAFVRDADQAAPVEARGGTPIVADLYDGDALRAQLGGLDAVIHTASPGDETSAALDTAVVDAALGAFGGTGKALLYISGAWGYGANLAITEDSPPQAPALVAWRGAIEDRVVSAAGVRGVVIVSSVAYGDGGGGVPGVLLASPRDEAGRLVMLGSGEQHWSTVHVADLADAFRRAVEDGGAQGRYVIGNGLTPTVAELTEAAAVAVDAPGAVPGSDEEAKSRLGEYFAEVLLLDQGTVASRASDELGWAPTRPGLVDELRTGSYVDAAAAH